MKEMDLERDYAYFKKLWEYRRPNSRKHTAEIWNARAQEWENELATDNIFRRQMFERVEGSAAFLRKRGLLTPDSTALDIGCGPGLFTIEFAKTASHTTGMDISSEMLKLGEQYAKENHISNVSFIEADFKKLDVDTNNLREQFDLVFASLSPAIGDEEGIDKVISMSRGLCFNCSPLYGIDHLEEQMVHDLLHLDQNQMPVWDQRWFYSLFNLLWLKGFLPETYYQTIEGDAWIHPSEFLIDYYTSLLQNYATETEISSDNVTKYFEKICNKDGKVKVKYKKVYGWILWDVRQKMKK